MSVLDYIPGQGSAPTGPARVDYSGPLLGYTLPLKSSIDKTKSDARRNQISIAGQNTVVRELYGRGWVGGRYIGVLALGPNLLMAYLFTGACDAFEAFLINDQLVPTGVVITPYTGQPGQTVDPKLLAAMEANGLPFTDTYAGYAIAVVEIGPGVIGGWPRLKALMRGRRVYDPRDAAQSAAVPGTWTWSQNPALATADFVTNAGFGAGLSMDWDSVAVCADACDTPIGDPLEPARRIDLLIDRVAPVADWIETLRAYAGVLVFPRGPVRRMVMDEPGEPVLLLDRSLLVEEEVTLESRGRADLPTVLDLRFTDASTTPWRDDTVRVQAVGVAEGTVPFKRSEVGLPGITRATQAAREAQARYQRIYSGALTTTVQVRERGGTLEPGDTVRVSHPVGLENLRMRVADTLDLGFGRYAVSLESVGDTAAGLDPIVIGSIPGAVLVPPPASPATAGDPSLPPPPPPASPVLAPTPPAAVQLGANSAGDRRVLTAGAAPVVLLEVQVDYASTPSAVAVWGMAQLDGRYGDAGVTLLLTCDGQELATGPEALLSNSSGHANAQAAHAPGAGPHVYRLHAGAIVHNADVLQRSIIVLAQG